VPVRPTGRGAAGAASPPPGTVTAGQQAAQLLDLSEQALVLRQLGGAALPGTHTLREARERLKGGVQALLSSAATCRGEQRRVSLVPTHTNHPSPE
jgi:hypothetical protein